MQRQGAGMRVTKDSLLGLLAHETTRNALGRLSQGEDVRRVAADVAGQVLTAKIAQAMGAAPAASGSPRTVNVAAVDIEDAEFTVVNESGRKKPKEK